MAAVQLLSLQQHPNSKIKWNVIRHKVFKFEDKIQQFSQLATTEQFTVQIVSIDGNSI